MSGYGYAPSPAAMAVGLVGYCSRTGQPFLVEADLVNGTLRWRSARAVTATHAKELGRQLSGGAVQNVLIDSSAFACPSCATPVNFWKCGSCRVFHCGGMDATGMWRGQCGDCRVDPKSVVVNPNFAVDPRARY